MQHMIVMAQHKNNIPPTPALMIMIIVKPFREQVPHAISMNPALVEIIDVSPFDVSSCISRLAVKNVPSQQKFEFEIL
jgi:hypothetical protein